MARDMRAETAALAHQNSNEITLEPCKPKYRFNRKTAAAHARSAGRSARHLLHLGQVALRGRHGVSQEHACRGRVWVECGEQGQSVGCRGSRSTAPPLTCTRQAAQGRQRGNHATAHTLRQGGGRVARSGGGLVVCEGCTYLQQAMERGDTATQLHCEPPHRT